MEKLKPCPTMDEIISFLLGEGELDGHSYGQDFHGRPRYWWRTYLREAWNTRTPEPQGVTTDEETIEYLASEFNMPRTEVEGFLTALGNEYPNGLIIKKHMEWK